MSLQKSNDINIIIEGLPNSGKTMIASLIAKALREAGITNIEFTNPEESLDVIEQRHQYIPEALRGRLAETKFTITEVYRRVYVHPLITSMLTERFARVKEGAADRLSNSFAQAEADMKQAMAPVRQLMLDHPPIETK